MSCPPRICPAATAANPSGCPATPACGADPAPVMPRQGPERAVMMALRFVAAAADTGDAACWDAALDGAEAAFGPRDGALLVARAAALLRAGRREGTVLRFLPPPCRRLSGDEAALLDVLRARLQGCSTVAEVALSTDLRAALSDLVMPLGPARPLTPRPMTVRGAPALSVHSLV